MFSLDTYDVLAEVGLANKAARAQAVADLLEGQPANAFTDVDRVAMYYGEIRIKLFGDDYSDQVRYELDEDIKYLTSPKGLVHYAMRNGNVLCSTTVERKLYNEEGGAYLVKQTARFVTHDDRVAFQYRVGPAFARAEHTLASLSELAADAQLRIPSLTQHLPRAIRRAHQVMQAELPMPDEDNS
jgi:hypothetical protein